MNTCLRAGPLRFVTWCAAASMLCATAARAQNVTLEATDVPLKDVLAEVRRQTHREFQLIGGLAHDGDPRNVSLSLADVPCKRALERVCEQAGVWFLRVNQTTFWVGEGSPPPGTVPSATADGYVIRVSGIGLPARLEFYNTHSTNAALVPESPTHLMIALVLDAPDDWAGARLYGLSGLQVQDEAGRALTPARASRQTGGRTGNLMLLHPSMSDPSTYNATVAGAWPTAGASAVSLTGEVVLFEECERVEISIPWGEAGETHQSSGVEVIVQSFGGDVGEQLTVTANVKVPSPGLGLGGAPGLQRVKPDAWLEWENDFANLGGFSASAEAQTLTFQRPANTEGPPQRLVYAAFVKSNPALKLPFTIDNIPLPQIPGGAATDGAEPDEAAEKPHPYWAEDAMSGSVEFDVMVDDQFVPGPISIPVDARLRKEDGTFTARAVWDETIDENGHVAIRNLKPGFYALSLRASGMGNIGTFGLQKQLNELFGINSEDYLWTNEFTRATVDIGTATTVDPVRFAVHLKPISPADGDEVPKDSLVFSWEPHPQAAAYQVGLGVKPTPQSSSPIWLSDPVEGTQVRYAPATGVRLGSKDELDLDPEKQYRWWVYALDAQGKRISWGPGHGSFSVK